MKVFDAARAACSSRGVLVVWASGQAGKGKQRSLLGALEQRHALLARASCSRGALERKLSPSELLAPAITWIRWSRPW
jgi:hypothetical protein